MEYSYSPSRWEDCYVELITIMSHCLSPKLTSTQPSEVFCTWAFRVHHYRTRGLNSNTSFLCFLSRLSFAEVRPVIRHSTVRVFFCYVSTAPFCWPFSLLSSPFVAHRSLFIRQSFHVCCCPPRFVPPPCFFLGTGNISYFILTMCPSHLIQLLTILPTMQALVPNSSLYNVFHPISLHSLYTGYSLYPFVRLIHCSCLNGVTSA